MHGAQPDGEEELELNYEENDNAMEVDTALRAAAETQGLVDISLDSPQRSIVYRTFREGTTNGTTERMAELHYLTTATTKLLAQSSPASQPAIAAELASLTAESHQLRNPQRLSIQLERHPSQPTPAGKGKAATTAKHKKKQPMGRSRSDGATRNRSLSKPRLFDTRGSEASGKRTMMQPTRLAARTSKRLSEPLQQQPSQMTQDHRPPLTMCPVQVIHQHTPGNSPYTQNTHR
eukprot:jgi/Tetstr1/432762/TSEL_022128.t1